MKRFLLLTTLSLLFSTILNAKENCKEKIYVNSENILFLQDKNAQKTAVVKQFYILGITHSLTMDKKGYFFTYSKENPISKGHFEYHYCSKCDQEFSTRRKYEDHVCKRGYYERQDRGHRICDSREFQRPSEFERPSEFGRF
jgi:hypothetical protein